MMSSEERKLDVFTKYMSQFATHRGADMRWVMEASSHGRIFSLAWDEATKTERDACAKAVEAQTKLWSDEKVGYALADAVDAIRERGNK